VKFLIKALKGESDGVAGGAGNCGEDGGEAVRPMGCFCQPCLISMLGEYVSISLWSHRWRYGTKTMVAFFCSMHSGRMNFICPKGNECYWIDERGSSSIKLHPNLGTCCKKGDAILDQLLLMLCGWCIPSMKAFTGRISFYKTSSTFKFIHKLNVTKLFSVLTDLLPITF
jgi:hypothetical protein